MSKFNQFLVVLLIITVNFLSITHGFRVFHVKGVETILALENELINIECKADMSMTYCGISHPSGKRYSFSGTTLSFGHCALKIQATKNDTGKWRCHIGTKVTGLEMMQTVQVRVVMMEVAAVEPYISAVHGNPMTIACATTKGLVPLSYCTFEPPNGQPFSINSNVTSNNPILERYYFPANRSLDRGDCAVTIRKVTYEDLGSWTCRAGFDDGQEHIDFIQFEVKGLFGVLVESAIDLMPMRLKMVCLFAILGILAWKTRQYLGIRYCIFFSIAA